MVSELRGTNPVHGFVLDKTRSATEFRGSEALLLAAVLVGVWGAVNALVGIACAALAAVGLSILRRADHGRGEHLQLRLRGRQNKRRYRLIESDPSWGALLRH